MSEEIDNIDEFSEVPKTLPSATATLVLGIISIVTCWLYGIPGIICGIIALSLAKKDKAIYDQNPSAYAASYKNSQAGKVCAIIGLSLSALWLIYVVIVLLLVTSAAGPFAF